MMMTGIQMMTGEFSTELFENVALTSNHFAVFQMMTVTLRRSP